MSEHPVSIRYFSIHRPLVSLSPRPVPAKRIRHQDTQRSSSLTTRQNRICSSPMIKAETNRIFDRSPCFCLACGFFFGPNTNSIINDLVFPVSRELSRAYLFSCFATYSGPEISKINFTLYISSFRQRRSSSYPAHASKWLVFIPIQTPVVCHMSVRLRMRVYTATAACRENHGIAIRISRVPPKLPSIIHSSRPDLAAGRSQPTRPRSVRVHLAGKACHMNNGRGWSRRVFGRFCSA